MEKICLLADKNLRIEVKTTDRWILSVEKRHMV